MVKANYPGIGILVERRIRLVTAHIARWPESMRRSQFRREVRVAPPGRYPYNIFYRIRNDCVEILHIHRTVLEPWDEKQSPR